MQPDACGYCTHPIEAYMPWDRHAGVKVHDECHIAQHNGDYEASRSCGAPAERHGRWSGKR